ncbi:MAG: hypothetical protein MI861_18290, partial [Pirellulales bacterium]|nr:hypothetical protein [Pirellulales bacterium]
EDCYIFLGGDDKCLFQFSESCGGNCQQENGEMVCADIFQNHHVFPLVLWTWDMVEGAPEGYAADSIEPVECTIIGDCICIDLNGDGIRETCTLDQGSTFVEMDEKINVNSDIPCPQTYPGT